MSKVSIKDLVERKNLRSRLHPIPGLGEVELFEISAQESEELQNGYIKDDTQAESRRIARWALRFMSAEGEFPSEEQVTALMENNSSDLIVEIFQAGLTYSAADDQAKARAEKN